MMIRKFEDITGLTPHARRGFCAMGCPSGEESTQLHELVYLPQFPLQLVFPTPEEIRVPLE